MVNHPERSSLQGHAVALRQVAAWDIKSLNVQNSIKASVSTLQRGLVWSPQQVELLWDSILRGLPIGSLVVCEKVNSQERSGRNDITHHLLDGQQRCNAITLGFVDPFDSNTAKEDCDLLRSILWLDLAPREAGKRVEEYEWVKRIEQNSTRQFLVRITTLAHPWGFQPNDNAGRLSAWDMREAVDWEYKGKTSLGRRPLPSELFPWRSNAPVPLSWLIDLFANLCQYKNRHEK